MATLKRGLPVQSEVRDRSSGSDRPPHRVPAQNLANGKAAFFHNVADKLLAIKKGARSDWIPERAPYVFT